MTTSHQERARTRDGRVLVLERSEPPTPADGPTVVFEAGMGASRHTWGAVVERVASWAPTVVYDRSGLGDSPPDAVPRTLDRLAADLVDVLDHLGDGPFVLVGHSWGGPIIRRAASQRPERVVGLVLVDVTEETCELFFSPASRRQTSMMLPLLPVIARTGVLRFPINRFAAMLPDRAAEGMRRSDGTVAAARTQQAELRHHIEDLEGLLEDPPVLPEVPVTYISGTQTSRMERDRRPSLVAAHREAAEQLPLGRHVTADDSSHYVPFTEPDLVADEIRRVTDADLG